MNKKSGSYEHIWDNSDLLKIVWALFLSFQHPDCLRGREEVMWCPHPSALSNPKDTRPPNSIFNSKVSWGETYSSYISLR